MPARPRKPKRPKQKKVFGKAALSGQRAPVRQGSAGPPSGGRKSS